ncbi:glycosyltransferase family 2 protein [Thioalkalivibrio sp. ALJ15]|uniref:glycosyltransferase family 2 protein n=1 Tax=Thioalkalivibrio sp. ALJ15 TaxID=748652 RepID=UPI000378BD84|nr:glycosyltransferase family 2 protein [Thioalkalivibrio sp. ALJ15]
MTPVVSVVTPVHNGAAFIRETITSVQAQTWGDWELLVVDDASEDDSAEIVEALAADDERIRVFRLERNEGAAVARNTAIEAARGQYIAFLDGDDLWLPHKLVRQLAFMREAGAAFSYGAYERVDENGRYLSPVGVPDRLHYRELLKTCYVGCLTAMYDTKVFGKRYMPLIRRRQDYALWLDLLRDGETAMGLNEVLGIYRVRSGSISSNKASTSLYTWRMYREVEGLSLARSAWFFAHQTGRAAVRHRLPGLARRLGWLHSVDGAAAGDCHRPCGPSQ